MMNETNHRLVHSLDLDSVLKWFGKRPDGKWATDWKYLAASLPRFTATHAWAQASIGPKPCTILDVGSHWLHNAFFYANDGHKLICADTFDTVRNPNVQAQAQRMGADLLGYRRLERGQALADLPANSVDVILFCEILEHITFNPIRMWSTLYDLLKPGGRIILTTPNVMFGPKIIQNHRRMASGEGMGILLEDIFSTGTYGHHWKEYSVPEIHRYFATLTPDFEIARCDVEAVTAPPFERRDTLPIAVADDVDVRGDNIFAEIRLARKDAGIQIKAPWEPV